jgi:hypothetical protein
VDSGRPLSEVTNRAMISAFFAAGAGFGMAR